MSNNLEDTQPKAPQGLQEAIHTPPPMATGSFPVQGYAASPPLAPPVEQGGGWLMWIFALGVIFLSTCMCGAIVILAGFAGVRDELKAVETQSYATKQADVATQYARANDEFAAQQYEIAEVRFEYVATRMPGYRDTTQRLDEVRQKLTVTPTPSPTITPTLEPTHTLSADILPSPTGPDPAALYGQAETSMNVALYEDAISYLEALQLLAPNYRRDDVQRMLVEANRIQGVTYLRGLNSDGEDRLIQGVQLIRRAAELGNPASDRALADAIYEADFVSRYVAARSYIEGGAFDQAQPILARLCEENCDWAYRGVSVRSLLSQLGGT